MEQREPNDWTPFHEVDQAVEHLYWLLFRRWRKRRLRNSAVAKDVQDALADLRPMVREAYGTWRRLALYRPEEEK